MNETTRDSFYKSGSVSKAVPSSALTVTYDLKWSNTRIGENCPGYKRKIARGQDATTNFTATKREVVFQSQPYISTVWANSSGTGLSSASNPNAKRVTSTIPYVYAMGPVFGGAPAADVSADNTALGNYYSNARKAISPAQGLVILGELRSTAAMLRNPALGLRNLLALYNTNAKKRVLSSRTKKQAMSNVSDLYLESVFGWLPLISDVNSTLDAYNAILDAPKLVRVRGFGEKTVSTSTAGTASAGIGYIYNSWTRDTSMNTTVEYSGAVQLAAASQARGSQANERMGFTVQEFVPALYNLAPWSFLIDYFTNIGDIVSATTFVNSKLLWTSKTTRVESVVHERGINDIKRALVDYPNAIVAGSGSYEWKTTRKTVERRKGITPGIPGLQIHAPGFKQALNILALATASKQVANLISKL